MSNSAPSGTPHARTTPLLAGRYRVLRELGRGGMGVVYQVRDTRTGRDLALKQLVDNAHAQSTRTLSLFEREFHVLSELAHPRVIAVYDYGLDPAGPFYTMELLEGGDLLERTPLAWREACQLLYEVCSSLALLHSRRLVHRDISPRNVRCTLDGHAKLIDFGAMIPMGPCSHIAGTPAFVAPEVVHRGNVDARTDLFSLGATLYYTLTGQPPFAARVFADLREAWRHEPRPASQLVRDVPPALDALCAALMRIDPSQRPQNAFEVMRRLETIAGTEHQEPLGVSQAYLTTPALVGRAEPLRGFYQCMLRVLHAEGSALCYQSASGIGRSRMLDACVLEAKTLGASVLRAAADGGTHTPFAVAQQLAEQLLVTLPEAALRAADAAGLGSLLFESTAAGAPSLRKLTEHALDPVALQTALTAWIAGVSTTHALMIAVDDAPNIDDASLALLAGLAMQVQDLRLMLVVTCDATPLGVERANFAVLQQHCTTRNLEPLTRKQTELLLSSVFGEVANVAILGDRLYKIALGNPRQTLALAQYLVTAGAIRYEAGQWTVPDDLDSHALPESIADAFTMRIRALPALARRLAETQALLAAGTLRVDDYAALAPGVGRAQIDAALSVLIAQEVVQSDGELYSLSHRGIGDALRASLSDSQKRERHLALHELLRHKQGSHPVLLAHHLLEAGLTTEALEWIAQTAALDQGIDAMARSNPRQLATTLERALSATLELGRPAREAQVLRARLCRLALFTDIQLHLRVGPAWLAQLEHDSGLLDYLSLPDTLEPSARLRQALGAAAARYEATDVHERVYRVDEAIKHLAWYVMTSLAVMDHTQDIRRGVRLAEKLAPFVGLNPLLYAFWQHAGSVNDLHCGKLLRARARMLDAYERYGQLQATQPEVVRPRNAMVFGIAIVETLLGRASAFEWACKLDEHPEHRVTGAYTRRLTSLMQGDVERARRFGREAELLLLRTSAQVMFVPTWYIELFACVVMRDVPGVKHVVDGVTALAARYPGWLGHLRVAEGHLRRLCGDPEGARLLFEDARRREAPTDDNAGFLAQVWTNASAGLCTALTELGRTAEAIELGEDALVVCARHALEGMPHRIELALALAELAHGMVVSATQRLDRVLREQLALGITGISLYATYEARAQAALAARAAPDVTRFATLALQAGGADQRAAIQLKPLADSARQVGIQLGLAPSDFEVSVLGASHVDAVQSETARLWRLLETCADSSARCACALEHLCELGGCRGGHLYLVGNDGDLHLRASRNATLPDAHDTRFARGFFDQQITDAGMTTVFTQLTHMMSLPEAAIYVDLRGREHRIFMLTCKQGGALHYVGVAVLETQSREPLDPAIIVQLSALACCLLRAGDSSGKGPPAAA